ncbi:MAG: hypothetical protein Kow0077_12670 [Anaerolineae bacterium]
MSTPIRLLIVEDSEDDALLILRELRKGGFTPTTHRRVDTERDLRAALEEAQWDIILADYSIPGFNGLAALEITKSYALDIPFIIVSGTIGEHVAVAAMKSGAHDYILKDKLARLAPAVTRELREAEARRARRQAEEQLRVLSLAVQQSPSMIVIADLDGEIRYINPRFTAIMGYDPDEVVGQSAQMFVWDERTATQYDQIAATLRAGLEWHGEFQLKRKDGRHLWASASISTILDEHDAPTQFLAVLEDTTQRHKTIEALRESEARFRQLIENTADAIYVGNRDGQLVLVNAAACQALGYTRDELLRLTVSDVDPLASPADVAAVWEAAGNAVVTREAVHRRKDGSTFPVEIRIGTVSINGEQMTLGIARDMTEHKRMQTQLQTYSHQLEDLVLERTYQLEQNMQRLQAILENNSDAIALTDAAGTIQTCNPAFRHLFEARTGDSIATVLAQVIQPAQIESVLHAMDETIQRGETVRVEARATTHDGRSLDADLALTALRDSDGEPAGIVMSLRDITHLKELDRLKSAFVANAAHDLANPISNIQLHLCALEHDPERIDRYLPVLQGQTRRMEMLVNDLRTLSQLERGQVEFDFEPLALHPLLEEVIAAHRPQIQRKRQQLVYTPAPEDVVIRADSAQFERVVVNLVSNALNYTPEGGMITIQTTLADGNVTLCVQDTGIGIEEDELPHIFERFYRSVAAKQADIQGTGLGLAIVKEIVQAHGGAVSVESTPGSGTRFCVRLPRHTP